MSSCVWDLVAPYIGFVEVLECSLTSRSRGLDVDQL